VSNYGSSDVELSALLLRVLVCNQHLPKFSLKLPKNFSLTPFKHLAKHEITASNFFHLIQNLFLVAQQ
jgi:hypothetical protein